MHLSLQTLKPTQPWSEAERIKLSRLAQAKRNRNDLINWRRICEEFPDRSKLQIKSYYYNYLQPQMSSHLQNVYKAPPLEASDEALYFAFLASSSTESEFKSQFRAISASVDEAFDRAVSLSQEILSISTAAQFDQLYGFSTEQLTRYLKCLRFVRNKGGLMQKMILQNRASAELKEQSIQQLKKLVSDPKSCGCGQVEKMLSGLE